MAKSIPLSVTHPELAKQWDKVSNFPFTPRDVTYGSNRKFTWVGDCQHRWTASIKSRAQGSGCPFCTNKKVLKGFNDLATTHSSLAQEWHPTKNSTLRPTDVTSGMGTKVWWQCDSQHEWQTAISDRKKNNCPYCSGGRVLEGFNDLTTTHPSVASEWHPTRNGDTKPKAYSAGSNHKKWWLCQQGHEWRTQISHRTQGKGCPICTGNTVVPGLNDLATTHPTIAAQWHATLNSVYPFEVSHGSHLKVWWQCQQGHEWETYVYSRQDANSGCPYCAAYKFVSHEEVILKDIVTDLLSTQSQTIYSSVRDVIPPMELDLYIPEKNLAIEFNGLYWHSEEMGKDRTYHVRKSEACAEKGIHLIHVWEDDWLQRRDLVIRYIAEHLEMTENLDIAGILLNPDSSLSTSYDLNDLNVCIVEPHEAYDFLEVNHLQGAVEGTLSIGLRDGNNTIRAIITIKPDVRMGEWQILRYATRGVVPDGLMTLIDYANTQIDDSNLPKVTTWVAYSDNALNNGAALYREHGFSIGPTLPPRRYCITNGTRNIATDTREGKYHIWDCGSTKWTLTRD